MVLCLLVDNMSTKSRVLSKADLVSQYKRRIAKRQRKIIHDRQALLFPQTTFKDQDSNLLITDNRDKLHEPEELLKTFRELNQLVKLQARQILFLREKIEKYETLKTDQICKAVEATDDLINLKTQVEQERLRTSRMSPSKSKKHKCIPPTAEASQILADMRVELKNASEQLHTSKSTLNEVTLKLTRVSQKRPQSSSFSENKLKKLQRKIKTSEIKIRKQEQISRTLQAQDVEGLKELLQDELSLGEVVVLKPSAPISSVEAWQSAPSSVRKELTQLSKEEKDLQAKIKEIERLLTLEADPIVVAEASQKLKVEKEKTWKGFEKELFSTQRHINERHDREAARIKKEVTELSAEISLYRLKLRHASIDVEP